MSQHAPTQADVSEARTTFYGYLVGSAGLMVAIHLMAPLFAGDQFLRFLLMVVWFSCLTSATWALTTPLSDYTRKLYQWKYADAGPAILHTAGKLSIRQNQILSGLGWLATVAGALCGLYVASFWNEAAFLRPMAPLLKYGWWATSVIIPFYCLFQIGALKEALQLREQLKEQSELSGYAEKNLDEPDPDVVEMEGPPVTFPAPMSFKAGGYAWQWADFYKNAAIFGMSGSGKTICVLNSILEGLIGASGKGGQPAAGLILDPKGDFRDKIEFLCKKYNRKDDLVVIESSDIEKSARYNPLHSDDSPLEIAGRFAGVMETLSEKSADDAYWIDNVKTLIQNLIPLLREAKHPTPPDLIDIYECATNDAAIAKIFTPEIAKKADEGDKTLSRALSYLYDVWEPMDEKPKSTVRTFISNMLAPFLQDPTDQLFMGASTKTMGEVLDEGKILYVYMPIAEQEVLARVVSTFVKLEFYREVLKRRKKPRPSFFLCDEFQAFYTVGAGRGDAEAFERTRESNHANVVAFQNMPALLRAAPKEEVVNNLLGNCATKIFLRNTEEKTNNYASNLFGEQIETLVGTGASASGVKGGGSRSVSANAQYSKKVKADVFPALKVPSREDGIAYAEAMCHMGARANVAHEKLKWKVNPLEK